MPTPSIIVKFREKLSGHEGHFYSPQAQVNVMRVCEEALLQALSDREAEIVARERLRACEILSEVYRKTYQLPVLDAIEDAQRKILDGFTKITNKEL